ncbi:MAG TPA: serine hydrolase domain-containing protein [Bryobacteraceae bacterium]|nr:serine hydrolase domain-containing protein [Bryobacteraceae bacterium]
MIRAVASLALVLCCWAAGAETLLEPDRIRQIEAILTREMSGQKIPGLTIAISRGADMLWTNGYGMSDIENFVPAKSSTLFRTASIAKPMTAVAVLQLVEQGKVQLDVPVSTYVKSFLPKQYQVTVRQLLGHLGGVRHYRDNSEMYSTRHFWNTTEALSAFQSDDLVHEPGLKMTYTTYGYVLLGAVVEAVSGRSYWEYLRDNVLLPAGMRATQVDDVYTIVPNRSRGYRKAGADEVVNAPLHDTSGKVPGGGLVSTSADLVRFVQALHGGKLLKKETVNQMFTSLRTADGHTTGYGLGWGMDDFMGRRRYGHAGGQAGVSTQLQYIPSEPVTVAIMCNLEGVQVKGIADRVLEVLLQ